MRHLVLVGLLATTALSAHAQERAPDQVQERLLMVGAGVLAKPLYAGSSAMEVQPLPVVLYRETFAQKHTLSLMGPTAAYDYAIDRTVSVGLQATYRSGRDASDAAELSGMADVDGTVEMGPTVTYQLTPKVAATAKILADVADAHGGYTAHIGLQGRERVGEKLSLTGNVGLTYASDDFQQAYFSVPAVQARADRPAYQADGGLHSVNVSGQATYQLHGNWHLFGMAGADVLVGDAADSPLTEQALQPRAFAGVAYKF
ncbi:MAG: MipA/OmpV family protein [Alphaproteobacteria bacterium]